MTPLFACIHALFLFPRFWGIAATPQIFGVANKDRGVLVTVVALNRLGIRPTVVNGDFLRESLSPNRLAQEGLGRVPIPIRRQQKVNSETLFVAA